MTVSFITATGTDIGKTYITKLLIRNLKENGKSVKAIKPIISGFEINDTENDLYQILKTSGEKYNQKNIENICLYRFKDALSPNMAAKNENIKINFNKLIQFCEERKNYDHLLIEGAGGVMVPLNEEKTILDLIKKLKAKVILVAGSYLGTISHTLTALSVLKQNNIAVDHVFINESCNSSVDILKTKNTIAQFFSSKIDIIKRGQKNLNFLY